MNTRIGLAFSFLIAASAACSSDSTGPDPAGDATTDVADAGGDATADTGGDVPADTGGDATADTDGDATADTGGDATADTGGDATADTGGDTTADTGCDDDDGDGVCNDVDICPGFDDAIDSDEDGVPDGCDVCEGFDDTVDTDEDGVPDGCDICEGFDDTVDTDEDGVPDGCDLCEGFDDAVDTDEDGVPDGCDVCPGWSDAECAAACAATVGNIEGFDNGVVGCAGSVAWEDRASLCGDGHFPASALEWVAARGEATPTFHYWTRDYLHWENRSEDGGGDCSAGPAGDGIHGGMCTAGPMRVCAGEPTGEFDSADPLGNTCTWVGCGWLDNTPVEYFGGCTEYTSGDDVGQGGLAGTLCAIPEPLESGVALDPYPPEHANDATGAMRGNVYRAESNAVLSAFDQRHQSAEVCDVDAYVWSTPSLDPPVWTVRFAETIADVPAGATFVGPSDMDFPIEAGLYYAFGLGWGCAAVNAWNTVEGETDVGFGFNVERLIGSNSYPGFSESYVPEATEAITDTYPQHVTVYGISAAP